MMLDSCTKVLIANTKEPSREIWLDLPFIEEELCEHLNTIGISNFEEDVDEYDLVVAGEPSIPFFIKSWESNYLKDEHMKSIFEASDLVERIEDLQKCDQDALDALLECGCDLEEALDAIEDGDVEFYPGADLTELAEQFGDEEMFSKEFLLQYIDWESIGRALGDDGYTEVSGGVLRRN